MSQPVQLQRQARHCLVAWHIEIEFVVRKPVSRVSDHVQHKPGCTATEDGQRLQILYLGSRGIVLSM